MDINSETREAILFNCSFDFLTELKTGNRNSTGLLDLKSTILFEGAFHALVKTGLYCSSRLDTRETNHFSVIG